MKHTNWQLAETFIWIGVGLCYKNIEVTSSHLDLKCFTIQFVYPTRKLVTSDYGVGGVTGGAPQPHQQQKMDSYDTRARNS